MVLMFSGGFFRGRLVRRTLGFVGALLAFIAGVLVLVASFSIGQTVSTAGSVFQILLALGALVGAWWIHRGSKAILFPRVRLVTAGFVTAGVGVLLSIVGREVEGLMAIGAGLIALIATIV